MATWTNIADSALEPGRPIRSVDGLALRDNAIAIAEGASGAPRVVNAALVDNNINGSKLVNGTTGAEKFQTGTTERDWVLARTASAAAGAVGSYALAVTLVAASSTFNSTRAGSQLSPASANGTGSGSLSGTWRCMGRSGDNAGSDGTTLWLRIS